MSKTTFDNLISRIEKLEQAVFTNTSSKPKRDGEQDFDGSTGGLRLLITKGFFGTKRSFSEIKEALAKNNYHYSSQAVQTPLNRLSKSGGPLVSFKENGKKVYAKRK